MHFEWAKIPKTPVPMGVQGENGRNRARGIKWRGLHQKTRKNLKEFLS